MPKQPLPHKSIEELKQRNANNGGKFFSPDTMRVFRSRVLDAVFPGSDGWYFVTSEPDYTGSNRRYTVRRMGLDGEAFSASARRQYASSSGALKAAERAARESLE